MFNLYNKEMNRIMENVIEYILTLKKNGLMDEYSDNHILIKAMRGEFDYFYKYPHLGQESISKSERDLATTFLMNFSPKLQYLSRIFNDADFNEFIENQLSAGKDNYSEEQFFRAASEINVLKFLSSFCGKLKRASYEPRLREGDTNPEARLEFENDIIFDVEVKTPGFTDEFVFSEGKYILLKPNVIISNESRVKLKDYCDEKNIDLIWPNILKLKDFIESAASKFENVKGENHFNLLFINWTYTSFPEWELNEPLYLLTNPISGLLHNKKAQEIIGLEKECMNKISAIVLYRDTFDTFISQDFLYHFKHNSFKLILNENLRENNNFDLLCELLKMDPYNPGSVVKWIHSEYVIHEDIYEEAAQDATNYVYELLWNSDELLSGINLDVKQVKQFKTPLYRNFVKKTSYR